ECPKQSKYQNQKAFVGGSWSDSDKDEEEKTKDEKCLMAKASNEDYARWEVIEYGNYFKPVARTTTNADGSSTSTILGPVTTEEKAQKKIDVKARSMLLMALPNEHQLTFSQYKDAKTFASSQESLNSISNRLQKIVSQLAILGENISQEDLNFKFLRSLPSEWSMHVVVWRNKLDLGIISFDDLYNNFKIVEQEVKRSVTSSSNSSLQNVAFVLTPGSSNEDNTVNVQVNTASTNVSTANDSTACLSDATIYAFLANQPNGSQVVHEDLKQIHEDDLEEMDLKWQLELLSLKARKFIRELVRRLSSIGPRNQESRSRNQESSKRTVNVEDTTSKAMVAFDGTGFDWSFMANEEVPTNLALMAFSDLEVYNHKTCSDTCLKSYETLKSQYNNLRVEFNKFDFDLATYKRCIASVEEQLIFYKKNEVMHCNQIAILKRDASLRDSEINALNIQIEKLKKDNERNQIKIDKFENASKSLDKLIWGQISDNNRKGVGYNSIPPPPTGLFSPPTIDLFSSGLKEFQQPEFEGYGVNVFDCDEDECEEMIYDIVKHKSEPKPEQAKQPRKINQNPRNSRTNWNEKKTLKLGVGFQFKKKACFVCGSFNHLIKDCDFHDIKMVQKPMINNVQKGTGQREVKPVWNNALRTNHQNFSNSRRNFAPTAVLTKSGIVPTSTARQRSSKAAAPLSDARPINTTAPKLCVNAAKTKLNVFQKAHSLFRRPFNQQTTLNNRSLNNKINTAKINSVNTTKRKRVTSAVGKQGINAVKSSACWVWRPKRNIVDHISKNSGLYICKPFDYVDPTGRLNGCSTHMTGNNSFLTDYQDYDGGFIAIAGSSKGGKITGKGKIKTGKLDFEDVYFVKELKFNLFSVSQMCDKKNGVLFTETECLILSPDFKLPDENQVMLKIPRKDNMYSFDLNNVVPSKGKQHKTSCKSKLMTSVSQPLKFLHMDSFGPTFVKSIMGKAYCLVVTDDYSKFSWVFFLAKKDETSGILKNFITGIENQLNQKVKIIRCDNETEFKNYEMNQLCGIKGIKREFSNTRTPQQNRVGKRKNRTLIEAARTMLADSLLPIPFWAEAVNIACYVQNRVLVTKPHNKTPYELLIGRTPIISFMIPFGYPVTILNTLDHLGKFNGKADEGFLVGYSINSKAFRVFNSRTRKLFDIDILTNSMNYQPVSAGNRTNGNAGLETNSDARQALKENVPDQEYILLPLLHTSSNALSNSEKDESPPKDDAGKMNEVRDSAKYGNINVPGEAINTDKTN
ncbi:ribonuclease H-like domain-containing protein, partial [Tanacetum coccineum]